MIVTERSRRESIDIEAAAISAIAKERQLRIACAESLTSGAIASVLGGAPDASTWFRGSVVAYDPDVKREVLGVTTHEVVSEQCTAEMALSVRKLLAADAAVSVTGVGGPGASDGEPAGTVIIAVSMAGHEWVGTHHLDGDPAEVIERTTLHALARLREMLQG